MMKKSGKIQFCTRAFVLLLMIALSVFLLGRPEGAVLYAAAAMLFLLAGFFMRRFYLFLGILIFAAVFIFTFKDELSGRMPGGFFNFVINSTK